jgi:hypothetical protein
MEGRILGLVQSFERDLDEELGRRPTAMAGTASTLEVAANLVEAAAKRGEGPRRRLDKGLSVLASILIDRTGKNRIGVEELVHDLWFAADYYSLREFLYFTYNAPGSVAWRFDQSAVEIRFQDESLPRQRFIDWNNWFLDYTELFGGHDVDSIKSLVAGSPEFEETSGTSEAFELIRHEAHLKVNAYFDLIEDRSVSVGSYSFGDFVAVFETLLAKALYHRYQAEVNDRYGVVGIDLDVLAQSIEETAGVPEATARAVIMDISYSTATKSERIDPLYFALLYLEDEHRILMRPYSFSMWEGMVAFLRLVGLRRPHLFLESLSNQLGDGLSRRLATAFEDAGFASRANVSLTQFDPALPDIDVLVVSEERTLGYVVLLIEAKSPVPHMWAKDQLRTRAPDSIEKAFGQLERIRAFLSSARGIGFLRYLLPSAGLPDFDEFLVAVSLIVVTSANAGGLFEGRGTVIDYRTLERALSRCDGDMAYLLEVLRNFPSWADSSLERVVSSTSVMGREVKFENVAVRSIMDFGQAVYRSAGVPDAMLRDFLELKGHPFDVLDDPTA